MKPVSCKIINVNMIRILFLFILGHVSMAQSSEDQDSLFIFFKGIQNTVLIKNKDQVNNNPKMPYPMDFRREYFINVFKYCIDCNNRPSSYNKIGYHFLGYPDAAEPFYHLEDTKRFLKRDFLDQNWFFENNYETVKSHLSGKVIMLVDPDYLFSGKYYVMRVYFNTSIP